MNICTIATEGIWVDAHLPRWVRYIRKNVPGAQLFLMYAGDSTPNVPVMAEFADVKYWRMKDVERKWLNSVRMSATSHFRLDSILYLDCDADVLGDISALSDRPVAAQIGAVLSPIMHTEWGGVCSALKWGPPQREWNNGLVHMKRDYADEYAKAWETVENSGVKRDRIHGTLAFNVMLHEMGDANIDTIAGEYGVIWHDVDSLPNARIVQYCNDHGQAKRINLEHLWTNAKT